MADVKDIGARIRTLHISELPRLDPITVFIQNIEPGRGKITVEVFGQSWSTYFGNMGGKTIEQFVRGVDPDYLATRFLRADGRRPTVRQHSYCERVCAAVIECFRSLEGSQQ